MTSDASISAPDNRVPRITVLNKQQKIPINLKAVTSFCAQLLQSLKRPDGMLSVSFVGTRTIRSINRKYRKRDYATDVLSFSYGRVRMEGRSFLGDIIIAPVVAAEHASRYGITVEKELRTLLVHGTLHLLGYDHERDEGEMNQMQTKVMHRKFFFASPSIMRREKRDDQP